MKHILAIGLFVRVVSGALFVLVAPPDPLAEFINADGGITIPGGLSPEKWRTIDDLLFGPKPSPYVEYTSWQPKSSPYATMELEAHMFRMPNLSVYVSSPAPTAPNPQRRHSARC